jgi:hypothetical protein
VNKGHVIKASGVVVSGCTLTILTPFSRVILQKLKIKNLKSRRKTAYGF